MAYRYSSASQVDIAILTVIPPELMAVRDAMGISESARFKDDSGTISYHGKVRSALVDRDYEVVLTCVGRAGNALSAAAVQDIIARYRPQVVLLVGIAAGVRGKVRIGDVVFSERVVAYEPAAVVATSEGGARAQPRPEIRTIPHRMLQDVVHYQPDETRLRECFERLGGVFPLPPPGDEPLYRADVATRLTVKMATVASGEKLLRDPGKLLEVRSLHGRTEVGEMEAMGLMEACERSGVLWLVIRGVSDFGDELKDDRFHGFAARAAAAVLADFVKHGLELTRPRRGGIMAVTGVVMLVAAAGMGVHLWAAQRDREPPPHDAAAISQPTVPKAEESREQEKPPHSSDTKQQSSSVPEPKQAMPEKKAAEATPSTKSTVGNLKLGNGARLKAGNVEGSGSAETELGDVSCGDNCVIEIGNKKSQ